MVLSLVGMMGSGKSSVGRELSALLRCPFIDLDSYIEKREGRSIPEIFREGGEAHFRALELSALREVISQWSSSEVPARHGSPAPGSFLENTDFCTQSGRSVDLVLALGGGTPTNPECAQIISDETLCIYLKASSETLLSHLEGENTASRPMLGGAASPDAPDSSESAPGSECINRRILDSRLKELLRGREAIYEKTARHTLVTDGQSVKQISLQIANLL